MLKRFLIMLLLCGLVIFTACGDNADNDAAGGTEAVSGGIGGNTGITDGGGETIDEIPAITVTLDNDYAGNWGYSSSIPKEDLLSFDGDVKVVVTYMIHDTGSANQFIIAPTMDDEVRITNLMTSDTAISKPDGWMACHFDETKIEFVIPADVIAQLSDDGGLFFQVFNVIPRSAVLSPGEAQAEMLLFTDGQIKAFTTGDATLEELIAEGGVDEWSH